MGAMHREPPNTPLNLSFCDLMGILPAPQGPAGQIEGRDCHRLLCKLEMTTENMGTDWGALEQENLHF